MAADNFSNLRYFKVKGTAVVTSPSLLNASRQVITLPGVVHGIIVGSHTAGTFRLFNGTATGTPLTGTYTPAAGSSVLTWEPIDFTSGIYIATGGGLDASLLYND